MSQKVIFKLETHPNRNHRPYHRQCETFLRNMHYHNFKNGSHTEVKIGIYCPKCKRFYPREDVVVIQ